MSNMAEGFGRGTQEEFITFLGYAIGSLDETNSHLCTAYDRGYLDKEQFGRFWQEGIAIRKITVAFIRAMILPRRGAAHSVGRQPGRAASGKSTNAPLASRAPPHFRKPPSKNWCRSITTNHPNNITPGTRYSVLSTQYLSTL
jgi:hypothetical protein